MTNFAFYIAHIYTHQGAPSACHGYTLQSGHSSITKHNFEVSIVNFDYLGPLEGTRQEGLIRYALKRLKSENNIVFKIN